MKRNQFKNKTHIINIANLKFSVPHLIVRSNWTSQNNILEKLVCPDDLPKSGVVVESPRHKNPLAEQVIRQV